MTDDELTAEIMIALGCGAQTARLFLLLWSAHGRTVSQDLIISIMENQTRANVITIDALKSTKKRLSKAIASAGWPVTVDFSENGYAMTAPKGWSPFKERHEMTEPAPLGKLAIETRTIDGVEVGPWSVVFYPASGAPAIVQATCAVKKVALAVKQMIIDRHSNTDPSDDLVEPDTLAGGASSGSLD